MFVGLPEDENGTEVRRSIINVLIKLIIQENVSFAIYSNQGKGFCCFCGPIPAAKLGTGQIDDDLNCDRYKNPNRQSG